MTDTILIDAHTVIRETGQGIAGPPGVVEDYTHTQGAPALTWTINHNLGRRPLVTLLSIGGAEIVGAIIHTSNNQAVASFATATAGSARCI